MAAMHAINTQPEAGTHQVGVGIGYHDNQEALAIGLNATSESGRSGYSASVSAARNSKPSFGAGMRWKF
jgi:autotransporter adhesin